MKRRRAPRTIRAERRWLAVALLLSGCPAPSAAPSGVTASAAATAHPSAISEAKTSVAPSIVLTSHGFSGCVLGPDAKLRCWAASDLWNGAATGEPTAQLVQGLGAVESLFVESGGDLCADTPAGPACWDPTDVLLGRSSLVRFEPRPEAHRRCAAILERHEEPRSIACDDVHPAHTCFSYGNGSVWCVGTNDYLELGEGTPTASRISGRGIEGVYDFRDVIQVGAGFGFSCALHSDGALDCWGQTAWKGTELPSRPARPVRLAANGVKRVFAYHGTVCALDAERRVVCWGLGNTDLEGSEEHLGDLDGAVDVAIASGVRVNYEPRAMVCSADERGSVTCAGGKYRRVRL